MESKKKKRYTIEGIEFNLQPIFIKLSIKQASFHQLKQSHVTPN